jgi:hypothetical protein
MTLSLLFALACAGVPNNGNPTRSGSPRDVERGDDANPDTGDTADTGGGGGETGGSDTGTWDTGGWDTGGGGGGGADLTYDDDLGSLTGEYIVTGTIDSQDDSYDSNCGSSGGGDIVFRWTPPDSGVWTFSTTGSGFDTILAIVDPSSGTELGCDDDSAGSGASALSLELGRSPVYIVVDSYSSGESGLYYLSIFG